ncbi:MAG: hypothetical protein A3F90_13590 [Deltaproteobacteria bacterium RIFCSPLOWO2_12_FULL_60_19]|nr:MAG: hypothetical protein A3F90_13590 [Deltaproteobacteria bacterium RIFCSPLOWO2_12_FULL_60_19]
MACSAQISSDKTLHPPLIAAWLIGNVQDCVFNHSRLGISLVIEPFLRIPHLFVGIDMSKACGKKEKWTLSFDRRLKGAVLREAKKRGLYPAQFLESLVREKFNPFGHTDIEDAAAYVRRLRKADRTKTDQEFLEDIRRWERIDS